MSCRRVSLCVVSVLAAAVVRAQQPVASTPGSATATNRLPELLVTSTRLAIPREETPTAVTIIEQEELAARQTVRVEEVLREVPGLEVVQSGLPGAQTTVFMRGSSRRHTLVLVDGIPANDGFENAFDFAHLPVSNIERIEVLRGPQSALYGSEAIGGVINIITRRGTGKPTGSVTAEGGDHDSFNTRQQFAGSFGPLSLSVGSGYFTTENDRPNAYYRRRDVSAQASYQVLERLQVSLQSTYLNAKNGVPNHKYDNDPNNYQRDEQSLVALTIHGQPLEKWDSTLKLSFSQNRLESDGPADPTDPPGTYVWLWDVETTRLYADWQQAVAFNSQHRLLLGGSVNDVGSDLKNVWEGFGLADQDAFTKTQTTLAGYGQYEFTPIERVTLTLGGRVDDSNRYGTHGTYRLGTRYTVPVTETILRASVGSGFRAPTFLELYFPNSSNPNLDPERSVGWDFGFEQMLCSNRLSFGATYFQNEYQDLIVSPAPNYIPQNISEARTVGLETFANWLPLEGLSLRLTYTWLPVAEDTQSDQRLTRRSKHTGSFTAAYRFLQRFTVATTITGVDDQPDIDPQSFTGRRLTNDGYVRADLRLEAEVCPNFTLFGRIENLTDEEYEPALGFPARGRAFWGGGTVRF